MHVTAQFLQLAMPHHSVPLWRDLTPKMMEYSKKIIKLCIRDFSLSSAWVVVVVVVVVVV